MERPHPWTNRDIYLAVSGLVGRHRGGPRALEGYLSAMVSLAEPFARSDALTPEEFVGLLTRSFDQAPPPFDESWRSEYTQPGPGAEGYPGWRATALRQVVDLREMAEIGTLRDEMRYFGVTAPRGSRWYNFDPATYLECGAAGSIEGWEPGDDSGREFVSGEVAVATWDGRVESCKPEEIERPVFEVRAVGWGLFTEFLACGQAYE